MFEQTFDVVDLKGTSDALMYGAGPHHEVLEEKLTPTVEQFGERNLAVRGVEDILLFNPDPGQRTLLGAQCVARTGELLFLGQQRLAGATPFFPSHNLIPFHSPLSFQKVLVLPAKTDRDH